MDELNHALWAYRAIFTQTGAGGGNVRVNIEAQERTVLLYGMIGPDNYNAARDIEAWLSDDVDNIVIRVMFKTGVDNIRIPIITSVSAAVAPDAGPELEKKLVMGGGDILKILAAGLIQNETLRVTMRGLLDVKLPTITTTGSTGTVTTTTTYSKVI